MRALVRTFLDEATTSLVTAAKHGGTAPLLARAEAETAVCQAAALEHPDQIPPCGADRAIFGWQEPVEVATVDIVPDVRNAPDRVVVRASMRYQAAFLTAIHSPPDDAAHFFAQLELVRVEGAWRVEGVGYDDEAMRRERGVDP